MTVTEEKGEIMDKARENEPEEKRENDRPPLALMDLIRVLGDDFSNIYCVDRDTQMVDIYRYENTEPGVREMVDDNWSYKDVMDGYIEVNVLPDDKEKMRSATQLEHVCAQLRQMTQFTVHYRVKRNNEILFYRMKCARIGDADSFRQIIFAFASEDADVRLNELGIMMKSSGATGKRKILIVEDDELNLEILCSLLEETYEIFTAENGQVGFKLLEEHYQELSLILLDVQMPVMNGYEFLKRAKEDVLLSTVPIIVVTVSDGIDTELACLDLGAADFITKPYHSDIVRKRIRNVIRLKESSLTLKAVEHDELTGLYTEQAFMHYVKQIMRFNPNKRMHVIVSKVKDFKLVNNIYGTKKADEYLCYLAAVFSEDLECGLLARKGSASFVCLFYGENELDHQKMRDTIAEITEHAPLTGVRVKYGVYEDIDKALPVTAICDYASMAADTVMDSYDQDLAYYTQEVAQKRIHDQRIENSFEDAIEHREFVVYYQPKVDILTEKVIGAEALVRWKKADGTMVPPGDFVPVFEKDGLIERLDEYVFSEVCQLQKRKMDEWKELLSISVNLSRSSIMHAGIAERYIRIVKDNGVPFSCVPLELTESAAIYSDRIKTTVQQLVDAGFELHVDDFGSGYSSLVSLNQLPFSTLKIDKSLVDYVCEKKGETLVEQVIMLSKLLNMKVIAEGVETKAQLDELRKLKCDEIQGFYYAKPMPEDEFIAYVSQNR